MTKATTPTPENMLNDIYSQLLEFPTLFRDDVSEECSWSTPTYYRKVKDGKNLSNAEKDKIAAVLDETFKNLWQYCEKYRKRD